MIAAGGFPRTHAENVGIGLRASLTDLREAGALEKNHIASWGYVIDVKSALGVSGIGVVVALLSIFRNHFDGNLLERLLAWLLDDDARNRRRLRIRAGILCGARADGKQASGYEKAGQQSRGNERVLHERIDT